MGMRHGGRSKGTPNKKTQEVQRMLEGLGCDPLEGMARIAMNDVACGCEGEPTPEGKDPCALCNGTGQEVVSLDLRAQMFKELAQYVAPKRKAIEHTGPQGEPVTFVMNID